MKLYIQLALSLWISILTVTEVAAISLNVGDILVADINAFGGPGGVIRVDPVTGTQTVLSSGGFFINPRGILIGSNGDILVADASAFNFAGGIIGVDPATGSQTQIIRGGIPLAFAINSSSEILTISGSGNIIFEADPTTGSVRTVSSGSLLVGATGIAVDSNGQLFVTTSGFSHPILRIDPVTGSQTIVSSNSQLDNPRAIAIDAHGNLLIADSGKILQVDPISGAQRSVSAGGQLVVPFGIGTEADGDILVADGAGRLIRIDPVSGLQTLVSSGGFFENPVGVAVVRQRTSVPEPSALLLLVCGLVVFVSTFLKDRATIVL